MLKIYKKTMRIVFIILITFFYSCKKEVKTTDNNTIKIKNEKSISEISSKSSTTDSIFFLDLKSSFDDETIKLPCKLNKNDICVTISISYGWLAYDDQFHYIFSDNKNIKAFKEKIPKAYLKGEKYKSTIEEIKLNDLEKEELLKSLISKQTIDFQNYNQSDFKNKTNKVSGCYITDNNGYSITFIQNNKYNSYSHYAPLFYLKNCNDGTVNKVVLEKFIDLLKIWNIKM